jgi:hypothetical protein
VKTTVALLLAGATALAQEVRVETRAVEGSRVVEVTGRGAIDAPPERVLAMLADLEAYPQLMPPTTQARLLHREGARAWFYMVIDPPVIAKRDYCVLVTQSRAADGSWRSEWQPTAEYCPPPQRGMIRIWDNVGAWVLRATARGATEARYTAHTDPRGDVPTWIVNRMTAEAVPDIFAAVRRAVALPKYARGK